MAGAIQVTTLERLLRSLISEMERGVRGLLNRRSRKPSKKCEERTPFGFFSEQTERWRGGAVLEKRMGRHYKIEDCSALRVPDDLLPEDDLIQNELDLTRGPPIDPPQ